MCNVHMLRAVASHYTSAHLQQIYSIQSQAWIQQGTAGGQLDSMAWARWFCSTQRDRVQFIVRIPRWETPPTCLSKLSESLCDIYRVCRAAAQSTGTPISGCFARQVYHSLTELYIYTQC